MALWGSGLNIGCLSVNGEGYVCCVLFAGVEMERGGFWNVGMEGMRYKLLCSAKGH